MNTHSPLQSTGFASWRLFHHTLRPALVTALAANVAFFSGCATPGAYRRHDRRDDRRERVGDRIETRQDFRQDRRDDRHDRW